MMEENKSIDTEQESVPADVRGEADARELTPVSHREAPMTNENPYDSAWAADLKDIRQSMAESADASRRTFSEIRELHRLYHNEFAGRLKSMQDELDDYHKAERGHVFDGILTAIARIYGNNETLAEEIDDPKAKKHIQYLLMDLLDLLEEYGVERLKSEPGDKRNPRHCQVLERIATEDPALHDTVAASHNAGFFMDSRTIIKEMVDVYVYDRNARADGQDATALNPADGTATE